MNACKWNDLCCQGENWLSISWEGPHQGRKIYTDRDKWELRMGEFGLAAV